MDLANWLVNSSPKKVYCSGGIDVFGGNEPNDKRCRDCDKKDQCPYFIDYRGFKMDYDAIVQKEDFCVYAQECDVHDNSLVLIDYENGARICYMECHFTPEYSREFMFVGDKGKILAGFLCENPVIIPESKMFDVTGNKNSKGLRERKESNNVWIEAILNNRQSPGNFLSSWPVIETAHLATVALRTGRKIHYDHKKMEVTNIFGANQYLYRSEYREGWKI